MGVLQKAGAEILARHSMCEDAEDPMSRGIVTLPVLRASTQDICGSERALHLALGSLERDGAISRGASVQGDHIVKFRQGPAAKGGRVELTEVDKSVVALKAAAAKTESEIEAIEARIAKWPSSLPLDQARGPRRER